MARVDMEILFECLPQKLTSKRCERVRCRVEHRKRNFISTRVHVLFILSYKHNSPLTQEKSTSLVNENIKDRQSPNKNRKVRRR